MKTIITCTAGMLLAGSVAAFAAPAACPSMQSHAKAGNAQCAAPAAQAKAGKVRYKAACGMTYSAAEAKKNNYICPMDKKPLTKIVAAKKATPSTTSAAVVCPVMGHKIASVKTAAHSTYQGKTYYFCCAGCKPKFDKSPAKYIRDAARGKFETM